MAKGLTPIIGLAVVVALAMVAVFGAMSLANPAQADSHLDVKADSVQLVVSIDGTLGPGSSGSPLAKDSDAEIEVSFELDTAYTPDGGDTVTITTRGVDLPSSIDTGDVRMWVAGNRTDIGPVDGSLVRRPASDDIDIDSAAGTITINIPDLTDEDRSAVDFEISNTNHVVNILFAEGAGIKTAAEPTVVSSGETEIVGTSIDTQFQWMVEGEATASGIWLNAEYVEAAVTGMGMFVADSDEPGDGTRYDVTFYLPPAVSMNTLTDEVVIKLADFDLPNSIGVNSVAVNVDHADHASDDTAKGTGVIDPEATRFTTTNFDRTTIAEDVSVSGSKIFITIGDLLKDRTGREEDADFLIVGGSKVDVILRQSAGVSNPTEYGDYGPVITVEAAATTKMKLDWEAENANGDPMFPDLVLDVPRILEVDPEDGGLGEMVTVTGKGFKNGTSLTIFVDSPSMHVDEDSNSRTSASNDDSEPDETDPFKIPNGKLDSGEDVLCVVDRVSSDDTGSCEFEVTHPTFSGGVNYINATDGRSGYVGLGGQNVAAVVDWNGDEDNPAAEHDYLGEFILEASVSASPAGGSPGEIMLVQVVDFPYGQITKVEIAREEYCSSGCGSVDTQGSGNFSLTIPNWVKGGVQELRISGQKDANGDTVRASTNVTFGGPQINVTPGQVLANQRVSLIGTGFSPGAVIANDSDGYPDSVRPEVSIGGRMIDGTRINDSDPVRVDNGGNWSASVDLPLAEATTAEGERAIRVSDSRGRTGVSLVDIPAREVTVTPDTGRVGTIAVVRGSGFPSKNDEGSSFNIEIVYDASNGNTTTVSATPDASGRFETQLRIPTTAAIPSSNSVKVSFRDTDQVVVVTTVAHEVPEGIVTLSETSGGPGSTITISGEGFKSFVPVSLVKVGTLDVTPAPKPSTDGNGMMNFDVTIPGLDVGIQTIEVSVGRTTASVGFTVTESGVNPGDIKEVAPSLEDLGDNFVNIWHFNNDTKAWSFYDGQEGSDLTHLITGETYLMQIKSTVEVILNGKTRNLTCVGANCWNQVVW